MRARAINIRIPNAPDARHLARVKKEMRKRGSPKIRVVKHEGSWLALEGSHRITAAEQLGIPIILVEKKPESVIGHDVWINGSLPKRSRVSTIVKELLQWHKVTRTVLALR
jgi:hypothetical protein